MGYHGNILLKTNVGVGEAEIEGLIYWEGGATDNASFYWLSGICHTMVNNSIVVKMYSCHC